MITSTVNTKFKEVSTQLLWVITDAFIMELIKQEMPSKLQVEQTRGWLYWIMNIKLHSRQVLEAKGLDKEVINSILNLYSNNLTVGVFNNVQGSCFPNTRWSIRQGDRLSSILFCYGLDPHLDWLENQLRGIPIYTNNFFSRTNSTEVYNLIAYVDDVKPSVTSMHEFKLIDEGSAFFESDSGCILYRDPSSGKVKFLPLGRW